MEIKFSTYNQEGNVSKIDKEKGVIYGVALANMGLNKNGYYFSERFLNELKDFGNKKGEVKARFEHPSFTGGSFGSFIGKYKNFNVTEGRLIGDLYLAEIARKTEVTGRGISLFDYVMGMAVECPEMFGNSIYVEADVIDEIYKDGDDDKIGIGLKLIDWCASDLVDDPAATNGLFFEKNKKENNKLRMNKIVRELLAFMNDFTKKVKEAKAFDVDLTLANGDIITVVTEGETPAEGDEVKKKTTNGQSDESALSDGEYLLKDEKTLVVEGGRIKEIREKEQQGEPVKVDEEFAKTVTDCLKAVMDKVEDLTQKFEVMKKTTSKFEVNNPRDVSQEPTNGGKKRSFEELKKLYESLK